jgi:hypothetical protein
MTTSNNTLPGQASSLAEPQKSCTAAPKWAAVIDDRLIPMPNKVIRVDVLREQASVPEGVPLIRDHNDDRDPVMPTTGQIDLGEGNVFYTEPECDPSGRASCEGPPKLAYAVNDRWEIVLREHQTGKTLRDLFELPEDDELLRDFHSPVDQVIEGNAAALFSDGCVFRTRKRTRHLTIVVNKMPFTEADGVKRRMTGLEIASLVEKEHAKNSTVERVKPNPAPIPLTEEIEIHDCDEFKVIRGNINAGYQQDRLDRELELLRAGGASVTLVTGPVPAVIYHDVSVRRDFPIKTTDVLVKIPGGYPGGIIDNAFLPADSPILGQVPGKAQQQETIAGLAWRQKSLHPHTGPKGIPWDKNKHGFHTYYSEIQNWLHAR